MLTVASCLVETVNNGLPWVNNGVAGRRGHRVSLQHPLQPFAGTRQQSKLGRPLLHRTQCQAVDPRVVESVAAASVLRPTDVIARGPEVPLVGPGIPISDAPMMLPPPPNSVLSVFQLSCSTTTEELAVAINDIFAHTLRTTGAVLLRNLPIQSGQALQTLLKACSEAGDPADWKAMPRVGIGLPPKQLNGMDLTSNVPAARLLYCHNESSFMPRVPRRALLACIQDAPVGGETTVARNEDLTHVVPAALQDFLRQHGGLRITMRFRDASNTAEEKLALTSWQERCQLGDGQGREDAVKFYLDLGFQPSQITWEEDGTLVVSHAIKGFVAGKGSLREEWFGGAYPGMVAGDGEPVPEALVHEFNKKIWECVYAFKLKPGDLLMLDNLHVQHGRLPYTDGDPPRCMVAVSYE